MAAGFPEPMAFFETLVKWDESAPGEVARAMQEAERFAAYHEGLARYARGLVSRVTEQTGGFTGEESRDSVTSSAPESPIRSRGDAAHATRSPPAGRRKDLAPLEPLSPASIRSESSSPGAPLSAKRASPGGAAAVPSTLPQMRKEGSGGGAALYYDLDSPYEGSRWSRRSSWEEDRRPSLEERKLSRRPSFDPRAGNG